MQPLPKCMVIAYAVAEPRKIVALPNKQAIRTIQEDLSHACPSPKIAASPYKSAEERKV